MRHRAFVSALLASCVAAPAFAADMQVKARPPELAPISDWSSIYVGGAAGFAWGKESLSLGNAGNLFGTGVGRPFIDGPVLLQNEVDLTGLSPRQNMHGFIAGGFAGAQKQWGNWVLGVEVSFDALGLKKTSSADSVSIEDATRLTPTPLAILPTFTLGIPGFANLPVVGATVTTPDQTLTVNGQQVTVLGQTLEVQPVRVAIPGFNNIDVRNGTVTLPEQTLNVSGKEVVVPGQTLTVPSQKITIPEQEITVKGNVATVTINVGGITATGVATLNPASTGLGPITFTFKNPIPLGPDNITIGPFGPFPVPISGTGAVITTTDAGQTRAGTADTPDQKIKVLKQEVVIPLQTVEVLERRIIVNGQTVTIPAQTLTVNNGIVNVPGQNVTVPGQQLVVADRTITINGQTLTVAGGTFPVVGGRVTVPGQNVTVPAQAVILPGNGLPVASAVRSQVTRSVDITTKVDEIFDARGKIGVVFGQNWMLYGTGGASVGHMTRSVSITQHTQPCANAACTLVNAGRENTFTSSSGETRLGWVVGAGLDLKLGQWVAGVLYRHHEFPKGSVSFNEGSNSVGFGTSTARVDSVQGRLSYHFPIQ
jgi:opacity protein-like surface antigen